MYKTILLYCTTLYVNAYLLLNIGLLTFLDPPRPDTKQTIENARLYGVQVCSHVI